LKDELIRRGDEIHWYPSFMKTRYVNWVENLAWDWCISRQRFFGVPFPVWYCRSCGEINYAAPEDLPVDPLEDVPSSPCSCGSRDFKPDADVMDTWATSSLTPHINYRWKEGQERAIFPMELRPQAHEIIRTWLFYTMVKSLLHNNEIPWKNVAISGFITIPREKSKKQKRGFKAEKISKSKHGSLTSPFNLLDQYGADSLRFWASNASLGSDMPLVMEDFNLGKRTLTKLWNAFRLAAAHLKDFTPAAMPSLEVMDTWMLSRLNRSIELSTSYLEAYDFRNARLEIGELFWSAFCDNYLEFIKDRLYNPEGRGEQPRRAAQYTIYRTGLALLKLYAPYIPHITEELYCSIYRPFEKTNSIHLTRWPEKEVLPQGAEFAESAGNAAVHILSHIRRFKTERNLSIKAPVAKLIIQAHPDNHSMLAAALEDLKAVGNVEELLIEAGDDRDEALVRFPDTDFPEASFPLD
jgi:valyl-tRNA synthetase